MKRVLIMVLIILVCVGAGFAFLRVNRIRGELEVVVNGESYHVDDLTCMYEDQPNRKDGFAYYSKNDIIHFKNLGQLYGGYSYSFSIRTDQLELHPQFVYMKTKPWDFERLYLSLELETNGEYYEGIMRITGRDGYTIEKPIVFNEAHNLEIQKGP